MPEGWKPCLIGAALSTAFGLMAYWLIPGLSNLSYDLLFLLRPRKAVEGVALVYMDDTSCKNYNQQLFASWDRDYHAGLIQRLQRLP